LGEMLQLSCHKQKNSGLKLDLQKASVGTSLTRRGSQLQQPVPRPLARDQGSCQALCIDANRKPCLAAPSTGAGTGLIHLLTQFCCVRMAT
jgi:hypothetical protein